MTGGKINNDSGQCKHESVIQTQSLSLGKESELVMFEVIHRKYKRLSSHLERTRQSLDSMAQLLSRARETPSKGPGSYQVKDKV